MRNPWERYTPREPDVALTVPLDIPPPITPDTSSPDTAPSGTIPAGSPPPPYDTAPPVSDTPPLSPDTVPGIVPDAAATDTPAPPAPVPPDAASTDATATPDVVSPDATDNATPAEAETLPAATPSAAETYGPPRPTGTWVRWQDAPLDTETGGPYVLRAIIGNLSEKDTLATIRSRFPDAEPYGDGTNYIYTSPETGRPTLFNPPDYDTGDVFEYARDATQFVFGTLGAAGGAIVGTAAGVETGPGAVVTGIYGSMVGSGIGTAYGGRIFDTAGNFLGRVDSRTWLDVGKDMAVDFIWGAVTQRAGEVIGAGTKALLSGEPAAVKRITQAFRELDLRPTPDLIGSGLTKLAVKEVEDMPFGGQWMEDVATKLVATAGRTADDMLTQTGKALAHENRVFAANVEHVYDDVFAAIGLDTAVPLTQVSALGRDLTAKLAGTPSLGGVVELLTGLEAQAARAGGSLPLSALRDARDGLAKVIAATAGSGLAVADAPLMRAYAAITGDMSAAARAANPGSAGLLDLADKSVRQSTEALTETLAKVERLKADGHALEFALQSGLDGGQALRALRAEFSPAQWETVAASAFRDLGKAAPGTSSGASAAGAEFSPAAFFRNWSRLTPQAKDALFGGERYADLRPLWDDVLTVTETLASSERYKNLGNATRAVFSLAVFEALAKIGTPLISQEYGAAALEAGKVAGQPVAAKLLTSRAFLRWMTTSPAGGARSYPAHFARLAAIVGRDPSLRESVSAFLGNLAGRLPSLDPDDGPPEPPKPGDWSPLPEFPKPPVPSSR